MKVVTLSGGGSVGVGIINESIACPAPLEATQTMTDGGQLRKEINQMNYKQLLNCLLTMTILLCATVWAQNRASTNLYAPDEL